MNSAPPGEPAAAQQPPSVRMFLLGGAGSDTVDVLARVLSEHGAPASAIPGLGGLSAAALQAVNREVAAVVDRLLELDLGELLLAGWRRYSELTKAAQRTLAHPGSQEMVVLASHRVVSTHHPRVDLLVDEARTHTFVFEVTVTFELNAVTAVVQRGELVALRSGECTVTVTLKLESTPLELTRTGKVDLDVVVPLRRPLPLVSRNGHPPRLTRPAPPHQV